MRNSKAIAMTKAELAKGCRIGEWGSYGSWSYYVLGGLVWAESGLWISEK